jgi:Histidine kinase-, DNA gyrase B-, and HSP90-like ATPase
MNMISAIERQKAQVAKLNASNFKYGLTVGAAFVRGIRMIGYKHTGTAMDELLDNAFEAGASVAHVAFGFESKSGKKPSHVAVIDNGVGMIPEMIRLSVLWGGTDRENSRSGIGRFGYGLPSSCMSQGRRFEVYSRVEGGDWHVCAIDLDEIEAGNFASADGEIVVPAARKAKLPRFVSDHLKEHFETGDLKQGTVVVIDKLDSVTWTTANALQDNLLKHFGVTYHKLRANFDIWVNGVRCEPIDPLFLTPGYRWYDLDAERAKALDPLIIDVKNKETREPLGKLTVRFSYMPVSFGSVDKGGKAIGKNQNARFWAMKEYNGFIISRMGRVIDTVRYSPLTTFVNNDRYFKIEIDFDAELDEEFNVPTNKQRVDVSDRIWEILEEHGLGKAIEQLRREFRKEKADKATDNDTSDGEQRPSETAMEKTAKLSPRISPEVASKRHKEGQRRLEQEIEKRAHESGKSTDEVRRELEAEFASRPYRVQKRAVPGGNFFDVEQIGGSKVLWINTATRFFNEVYAGPDSTPSLRFGLEVMLFSIGDRILDAQDELRSTYSYEVPEWSKKLEFALGLLNSSVIATTEDDTDHQSASEETGLDELVETVD